jgi:hypothetical protein
VIVHEVVPVGSPVVLERYEAVTEPWMSYPPLMAYFCTPAMTGQLTVKVF